MLLVLATLRTSRVVRSKTDGKPRAWIWESPEAVPMTELVCPFGAIFCTNAVPTDQNNPKVMPCSSCAGNTTHGPAGVKVDNHGNNA